MLLAGKRTVEGTGIHSAVCPSVFSLMCVCCVHLINCLLTHCFLQRHVDAVYLSSCSNWNSQDSKALSHWQSAIKVSLISLYTCLYLLIALLWFCLQITIYYAFSALTLLVGWQEGHPACKKIEWWGAGVVICLERGADLHMPSWCHCHSLSLAPLKSRLVLSFWYRLTRVVWEKGPLNGCVCVCVTTY